jgi:hypothetical protein
VKRSPATVFAHKTSTTVTSLPQQTLFLLFHFNSKNCRVEVFPSFCGFSLPFAVQSIEKLSIEREKMSPKTRNYNFPFSAQEIDLRSKLIRQKRQKPKIGKN